MLQDAAKLPIILSPKTHFAQEEGKAQLTFSQTTREKLRAFDCDADACGDLPVGLTYNTFPSPHSHTLSLSEKVASSGRQASRPRNMISKVIASKLTRQRMESIISIRHITPCCCSASKLDPTGISPTLKD